jgi:ribosomal protein S18 acetylase RimI-like enzyme
VIDAALLARIEDAGINASAPREQRWVDGWLVRLSPGKAKRARCIQAVAPGRLGIDEKLALCLPLFAAAGLPAFVRITPFSEPAGLDAHLAARGMERVDDTRVMVVALDALVAADAAVPCTVTIETADAAVFAEWIGLARGSSPTERCAHADRIAGAPVPRHNVFARAWDGEVVACAQVVIEGDVAGLYDVFTPESARGRGHAQHLCRHLLGEAAKAGARVGYLQVDAANDVARRIYRRLGFVDGYAYHYRMPATGAS